MASDPMSPDDAMLELVTTQHKMIMSLLDKNEALLKALEPFANEYDETDSFWWAHDDNSSVSINRRESDLTVGDFRKARAAIAKATGAAP